MTSEEYFARQEEILSGIPKEFHGFASMQAYDRGHSAGYEEVLGILEGIVFELKPAIESYKAVR